MRSVAFSEPAQISQHLRISGGARFPPSIVTLAEATCSWKSLEVGWAANMYGQGMAAALLRA